MSLTQQQKEREEELKKLITTIKPRISAFSYTIHKEGRQREEVTCGGKIKYIVDTGLLTDNPSERVIYVTIDDGLGELLIVIPSIFWDNIHATIGDVVIAEGILFSPPKECEFESKAGDNIKIKVIREDEPFRVLVKSIEKINMDEGAQ
ncbi:DNA-binding protein [Priestia megaterium]